MSKKLYIKTFGCQMNVYDSSRMADLMYEEGYELTENMLDSDLIILNTCHIREKAKEKIFSELGKIKEYKQAQRNNYVIVVVAGCVARAAGDEILKRMPIVDIVVSGESYHKLPSLVRELRNIIENKEDSQDKHLIDIELNSKEKFQCLPQKRYTAKKVGEFVAVQSGCDKFCTYCVVPYTRGREYSRDVIDILNEVKMLSEKGIKEITLLGQNVDNYQGLDDRGQKIGLAQLIYKVHEIQNITRIRYVTSYPSQFSEELIKAHKDLEKLMPFVHLPVQSGSNKVLKLMNRKYTREQYIDLIYKLREAVPNVAISSDFIVGFAGENEEDFAETIDLVEKITFASAFSFKYSPRPNTLGIKMPNQVPEKIKQNRLDILQDILERQQIEFNANFLNKPIDVLIENQLENNSNMYFGKTPYMQPVIITHPNSKEDLVGQTKKVLITQTSLKTFKGNLLQ